MRYFCELTNQNTALGPCDRARKCSKVLQPEKRKAQQVMVHTRVWFLVKLNATRYPVDLIFGLHFCVFLQKSSQDSVAVERSVSKIIKKLILKVLSYHSELLDKFLTSLERWNSL